MKVHKNIASSTFLVILSIVIYLLIPHQIAVETDSIINARLVPKFTIILMFLFSLILLIKSIINAKRNPSEDDKITINFKEEIRVLLLLFFLFGYVVIMPLVGFIISSLIVAILVLVMMKVKKWTYYLSTIIAVFIIYYIFTILLNIPLP